MKTTLKTRTKLDDLVTRCTAFAGWVDLVTAMGGAPEQQVYVPTLNGGKSYAKLAGVLARNGYKSFRNGRVS